MTASRPREQEAPALCPLYDFLPPPQANETFAFVGNVTHYAKAWLNISPEIRAYLEEGRLQRRIHWLQQVGQCGEDQPAWDLLPWQWRRGCRPPRYPVTSSWGTP